MTEPFVDRTFRGGTTSATDFRLSVLTNRHKDYQSVKEQFKNKWVKPDPAKGVSVVRIFKVEVRGKKDAMCVVCRGSIHVVSD